MQNFSSRMVATQDQISTELEGEVVVLNTKTGRYYTLDGVGTEVWQHLQDGVEVVEICRQVEARYDVTPERCRADVLALLQDLSAAGLVERVG
ncbi:PqqD family protein [soil metagenome]